MDSWMAFSNSSSDEASLSNPSSSSNESSDGEATPSQRLRLASLAPLDDNSTEDEELIPQLEASRAKRCGTRTDTRQQVVVS